MAHLRDRTLLDIGRRNLNVQDYYIEEVIPDWIVQDYPNLVNFIKEYYAFEEDDLSPSHIIKQLFFARDITQTELELLSFIEDELLLGQAYFEGFPDKREAAKYSNTLYRSKGTKFTIQQFFRTFFQIDPDVIYGKEQVFFVGEDHIGPESQRYLTNDKLYQMFAILIKTELSIETWREVYKLFAHPAGMYLGGEVQIVTSVDMDIEDQPNPGVFDVPPFIIETEAEITPVAITSATGLFDFNAPDGTTQLFRTTLGNQTTQPNQYGNDLSDVKDATLEEVANLYTSIAEMIEVDSPTLDEDSDGNTGMVSHSGFDISSTETIDQDKFDWKDSDDISNLDELFDSDYNNNL